MANDYRNAIAAYQEAIADLYAVPVNALRERGAEDIAEMPDLDVKADTAIARSKELSAAAEANMATEDISQRQLTQMQLLAAAAIDLHLASDLARKSEEAPGLEIRERSAELPGAISELNDILNAEPDKGVGILIEGLVERGGPATPAAARQALKDAVELALEDIKDDAASVGQATFSNLMQLPAPQVKDAANIVLAEVMNKLGEGVSKLLAKAVQLVTQAIDKLLAAIGKDTEDAARKQAAEWIEDLQKGTLFEALVERLYEIDRIFDELDEHLDQVPGDVPADTFNQAKEKVDELVAAFRKQKKSIEWLLHGLAWARPWIMGLTPWGPVGLTAGYVLTIGYIVYSGGDYIDWHRTGDKAWLDRVPGVRSTVDQFVFSGTGRG